jgi:hypothetical protein
LRDRPWRLLLVSVGTTFRTDTRLAPAWASASLARAAPASQRPRTGTPPQAASPTGRTAALWSCGAATAFSCTGRRRSSVAPSPPFFSSPPLFHHFFFFTNSGSGMDMAPAPSGPPSPLLPSSPPPLDCGAARRKTPKGLLGRGGGGFWDLNLQGGAIQGGLARWNL